MHLPTFIVSYSKALLSAPWRFTIVYLSLYAGKSHDVLTRGLKVKYSWKEIFRTLLSGRLLDQGYLILDETDIDKSFAEKIQCLSWIFSNRKKKYIFGLHLVVIAWTNGVITLPLSWKIYQKDSGKTKIDLAMELISYAICTLSIHPKAVLFDSFYAAEKLLKLLLHHDQTFYSQLPKNRTFDHEALSTHNKGRPYWTKTGTIKGNIQVQIVKNRRKYYITNAIGVARKEHLAAYKMRWKIEEIFRFTKKELGLEKCQAISLQGQHNHFAVCFYLYARLQDTAEKTRMTDYRIKLKATQDSLFAKNLVMSMNLTGA